MPELIYDTEETVPADLKADAVKNDDGKFVVNVVPASKLKEFRDNNVNLSKKVTDLEKVETTYKALVGEKPDEFMTNLSELKSIAQQVKDGKLKGTDTITREVETRTQEMKETHAAQIREAATKYGDLEAKYGELGSRHNRSIVDREVTNAALAKDVGVNATALPDVLTRANTLFSVTEEGKLVAKDGDAVIFGADGVSSMSPVEWMAKLKEDAPHLFAQSSGGGANGGEKKRQFGGMAEDAFNKLPPTERLKVINRIEAT